MHEASHLHPLIPAAMGVVLLLAGWTGEDDKPRPSGEETKPAANHAGETQPRPVLDAVTTASPRYEPMKFATHEAHSRRLNARCNRCHHDMKDDKSEPGRCATCHGRPKAALGLVDAYHGLCRDCHRNTRANQGETGPPTDCLGCHRERGTADQPGTSGETHHVRP